MAFLGRYWDAAGWTILHLLWLGTAVGLLCALARLLLRRAAPQVRYVVTLAFLAILAAGPPVIFGVVLKRQSHDPTASDLSVAATDEYLDRLAGGTLAGSLSGGSGSLAASVGEPAPTLSQADQWIARAENGLTWTVNALPWLWLVGAPATLAYLLTGVAGAERLRRSSQLIEDGPIAELCVRWCDALGIARQVLVGVSERVATPILLGITRPLVLLPPSMVTGWPLEQVEMVLLHELAHVRRWDNLVNLVQRLVESALFFHPVVWKVSSWARLDREQCCDATVLEHLGPPQMYAETLAALAVPGLAPRHAVAALANHQLVSRIRHILKREERTMRLSLRWLSVVIVAAVTSAALVTAWAQTTGLGAGGVAAPAAAGVGVASGGELSGVILELGPKGRALDFEWTATGGNCRGLVVGDIDHDGVPDILVASTGQRVESMQCTSCHANAHAATTSGSEAGFTSPFIGPGLRTVIPAISGAPWGPEQATGPPDTKPGNDVATAWASRTTDGQDEWLDVTFEKAVPIVAVMIHETLNPGAVANIAIISPRDGGLQTREVWEGEDPIGRGGPGGMSIIQLRDLPTANRLVLLINSHEVPGWNEIDAVGIIDTSGQVQWAKSATASSSYAEVVAVRSRREIDPRDQQIRLLEQQLQQLQSELQQLKAAQSGTGAGSADVGAASTSGPDGTLRGQSGVSTPDVSVQLLRQAVSDTVNAIESAPYPLDAVTATITLDGAVEPGPDVRASLVAAALEQVGSQADPSTTVEQSTGNSTVGAALAAAQTEEVSQLRAQLEAAQAQLAVAQATAAKAQADEEQARAVAARHQEQFKRYHDELLARKAALAQDQAQAAEAQAQEKEALSRHYDQALRAQATAAQRQRADAAQAQAKAAEAQQNATQAEAAQLAERLGELTQERSALAGELHGARRRERSARILEQATKRDLAELVAECEKLKADGSPHGPIEASERQVAEAKASLRSVLKDLSVAGLELKELQAELEQTNAEIAKLQDLIKKVNRQQRDAEKAGGEASW